MTAAADSSLWRNRPLMALCGARAVSFAGDQIATVALVLLIARDRPATAVGGLLLAEALPWLLSPFVGVIADRVERRALMIGCQLVQAVVFGAITIWLPPYAALLALVAFASLMGALLRSATHSSLPELVPGSDLLPANALLSMSLNASVILGPALGGVLTGLAGPRVALATDTATFLVSAATLLWLPRLPAAETEAGGEGAGGALAALRFSFGDPVLRALLVSTGLVVAFAGVDNVALVFLVRDTLGGDEFAFGAAMAAFGAGMVLATVLVMRFRRWRAESVLVGGTLSTAVGTLLLGVSPALAAVFPAQIVAGAGNGAEVAGSSTLIQTNTPPGMIGRVTGASQMCVGAGFLSAYLGGGALVEATSPRTAFVIAGAGTFLAVAVLRPLFTPAGAARPGGDSRYH